MQKSRRAGTCMCANQAAHRAEVSDLLPNHGAKPGVFADYRRNTMDSLLGTSTLGRRQAAGGSSVDGYGDTHMEARTTQPSTCVRR